MCVLVFWPLHSKKNHNDMTFFGVTGCRVNLFQNNLAISMKISRQARHGSTRMLGVSRISHLVNTGQRMVRNKLGLEDFKLVPMIFSSS